MPNNYEVAAYQAKAKSPSDGGKWFQIEKALFGTNHAEFKYRKLYTTEPKVMNAYKARALRLEEALSGLMVQVLNSEAESIPESFVNAIQHANRILAERN